MTQRIGSILLALLAGPILAGAAGAAKPASSAQAMQVLKANCVSCHNEEKKKGGLLLTSREAALKGGDEGPAFVPGKPEESSLIKVLKPDADPHMPPKKQLSGEQMVILRTWVQDSAVWDDQAFAAPVVPEIPVQLGNLPADYQPVLAVALSKDGKRLATGRGNRITIYDVAATNRPVIGQLTGPRDAIQSLAWSPDGQWLAAGEYRRIWLWDAKSFTPGAGLTNSLVGRITALEFTPDSTTLAAADGQVALTGMIQLWNVKESKLVTSWNAHKDTIFGLRISHNGKFLATGSADKLAKVWDLSTQKEVAKFEGHTAHVLSVAFNSDDTSLATGSADKDIKIWDLKSKEKIINLSNRSVVTALAWSVDGKSLVSVADDGTPKVYTEFQVHAGGERSKGAQEKSLNGVSDILYCVAANDAKAIYAGCHDGAVYLWGTDGKAPVKLAAPAESPNAAKEP